MGRRATHEYNLAVCNPELASEWHPTKNGHLMPCDVTPGSHKKVWWMCSEGHERETQIKSRALNGHGCAVCAGQTVTSDNNLAVCCPELANEWHPTKNGDLTPYDVTSRNGKNFWWMCSEGHEWETAVYTRSAMGCGCPACYGRCATSDNNLAVCNPDVAKEWHPTKNGDLTPYDVTPSSNQKVWWMCSEGHEWGTTVGSRNSMGTNCKECAYANRGSHFLEFDEAHRIVIGLKLKTGEDYREACRTGLVPKSIPRAPNVVLSYKDKWKGTTHWLRGDTVANRVFTLLNFFVIGKPPYKSVGKEHVCEMAQNYLGRYGHGSIINAFTMPGNGRELVQFNKAGFTLTDDSLGVERCGTQFKVLRALLPKLVKMGILANIIPLVKADVDKLLQSNQEFPEYVYIHLDYCGPLIWSHVFALEAALRRNPNAIVIITVQANNAHGWRINYTAGQLPFQTMTAELLFFQPYLGRKTGNYKNGCPMEAYCFINKVQRWSGFDITKSA